MALFRKTKNTKAAASETTDKPVVVAGTALISNLNSILKKPRITEKASFNAENNVYLFEVAPSANKKSIAAAVREFYKVNPVKVTTVKIPSKRVIVRGKRGVKVGGKKAYIYLAKGQTIEFA